MERAIEECITEGVLKEFLRKNRAEVKKVSIYEYNEEKHIQHEREAAKEDGKREGRMEGETIGVIRRIQANIRKGIPEEELAELFGEEVSFVREIGRLAGEAPELDAEGIFELWRKNNYE